MIKENILKVYRRGKRKKEQIRNIRNPIIPKTVRVIKLQFTKKHTSTDRKPMNRIQVMKIYEVQTLFLTFSFLKSSTFEMDL